MGLEGRIGVSSCLLTHASRAAWRTSVVKVAGVIKGAASRDFFGTAFGQMDGKFEGFRLGDSNV